MSLDYNSGLRLSRRAFLGAAGAGLGALALLYILGVQIILGTRSASPVAFRV